MALASYGTKIDLRDIPVPDRQSLVVKTSGLLEAGQTLELVVDHDPALLFRRFVQESGAGRFGWDYLERGPGIWRVRIMRVQRAEPMRL